MNVIITNCLKIRTNVLWKTVSPILNQVMYLHIFLPKISMNVVVGKVSFTFNPCFINLKIEFDLGSTVIVFFTRLLQREYAIVIYYWPTRRCGDNFNSRSSPKLVIYSIYIYVCVTSYVA